MDDVGLRSSAFRSLTGNGHAPSPGPVLRIRLQPPRAESRLISQSNYNQKRRPHQSERTLPFLRVQLRNNPAAQRAHSYKRRISCIPLIIPSLPDTGSHAETLGDKLHGGARWGPEYGV